MSSEKSIQDAIDAGEVYIDDDGQDATETINLEPHWPSMFDRAVRIVGEQVSTDNGQEFVREMLEYGKRLYEARQSD